MAVGPIEVIRAQEATQLRHVDSQRAQHAQEQLTQTFQEAVKRQQEKPKQTTNIENQEYRYDAKEKGNGQYSANRGGGNKKKEEKETADPEKKGSSPKKGGKSGGIDLLI